MAKKQKTRKELEQENRKLKTKVREYKKTRIKQIQGFNKLVASGEKKDRENEQQRKTIISKREEIERQSGTITSRDERITILETQEKEMQKRLNESWDKKQTEEVIGMLLDKLTDSGVIPSN